MKNPKPIATNSHLTQQQLLSYHAGELDAAAMHRAERHLLDCELCSDALEGLEQQPPPQARAAMADVHQRLAARIKEPQRQPVYWQWAVAASVLLLVTVAVFLLQELASPPEQLISKQEELPAPDYAPQPGQSPPAADQQQDEAAAPPIREKESLLAQEEKPAAAVRPQQQALPAQDLGEAEDFSIVYPEDAQQDEAAAMPMEEAIEIAQAAPEEERRMPELAENMPVPMAAPAQPARVKAEEAPQMLSKRSLAPQTKQLKGKVIEASTGEPLPGVSVRVKGSNQGTVTDIEGKYSLELPATDATIAISFIGYSDKVVAVDKNTTQLIAKLEEDVASLSEVVVTGYGTEKGTEATAAKPAEGMRAFKKWVKAGLRYPEAARQAKVEGAVVLSFYVEPNGSLTGFKVQKPLGYGLDEEAIRLVQEGPEWQPATINGEAVGQQARVRISFKLPKD